MSRRATSISKYQRRPGSDDWMLFLMLNIMEGRVERCVKRLISQSAEGGDEDGRGEVAD